MTSRDEASGLSRSGDVGFHTRRSLLAGAAAFVPLSLRLPVAAEDNNLVLVLGASGPVGQYVAKELRSRNYRVRGVTRNVEDAKQKYPDVDMEWARADLQDPTTLANVMPGVDKVIFVAGARGPGGITNNRKIYAEAVGELARLSTAQGVSKFILLSSGGVTIDSPSWGEYIRDVLFWKSRGENLLRASGTPYAIVRFYSFGDDGDQKPIKERQQKRGTTTGDLQLFQGDRPDVGGLITRHDLAVVTVEAMEKSPLGDSTSQGVTFEVIDRELQYFACKQGTCVGRVQPKQPPLLVTNNSGAKSSAQDLTAASTCSVLEEDDCEWRRSLMNLDLDKPK